MDSFYPLNVACVARNTRDAVVVTLDVPDNLRSTFSFRPGQSLTSRATIDGQDLRRSYSLCAPPHAGLLLLAFTPHDTGPFATCANDILDAGPRLDLMQPACPSSIWLPPNNTRPPDMS